ncbi:MAG: hypothetical protein HOQ16_12205 [Gemmatimonadaceae bacterium]|nr:hypothetical protein [Gemmatimonadaceae bacterium]NUS49353.1 hypothetical protein [Gemmatimonadaceae bacterium]
MLRSQGVMVALFCLAAQASAQGVLLRVHPHVGDTLHTRLEQQTEVSTVPAAGARGVKSVTTSVVLNSRTIVQESTSASTVLLTIVDSADLHTSDAHGAAQVAAAERTLRGQQLVLRLGIDGTVESAHDARGVPMPRDVVEAMAAMPAVFPRRAVGVGDTWTRELPLPAGGPLGAKGAGRVSAVFRLDSLDRASTLAYVSMRGEIVPEGPAEGVQLSGAVQGAMLVDRLRGWMTDSHFIVTLHSLVTPPAVTGLAPMRFVTKVTQRLRTMDKR